MTLVTRPGILGASVRFWKKSYAADYITIVVLAISVLLVSAVHSAEVTTGVETDTQGLFTDAPLPAAFPSHVLHRQPCNSIPVYAPREGSSE